MILVLGLFLWESQKADQTYAAPTPLTPTTAPPSAAGSVPDMPFADITEASGVRFTHYNGAEGEKLLPETMGAGVAIFDYDADGRQDLLFANGADWPWAAQRAAPPPTPRLFHNVGNGRFEDVTAASGFAPGLQGGGIAVGDFDNDGKVDVFLTGVGGYRLYHNEGQGRFQDVTAASGLSCKPDDWSTSAAWIDYDNDGDLDLFICHYVRWSRGIDKQVNYRLVGVGRAYGPPNNFPGNTPRLFRNDGGHFVDVTETSGLLLRNPSTGLPIGKSLGVAPVDVDRDGWIDFVVANDTVQNFVFHNERNGRFKEVGALSGIAFDSYGATRGAMGIDAARMQEEDQLAIAIGNFANEMTALYVSQQNPMLFSDEAISQGLGPASRRFLTFGVFFFDADLDGWLDFLTCNGHIEEAIPLVQKSQTYRQPAQLYWNARGKGAGAAFVTAGLEKVGPALLTPIVGRGAAFGDLDGDGDLDVVLTQTQGPPLILRNDQRLGNHWIRLKLEGKRSNRDAIGAAITVRLAARTIWRQVMPTRGYLSQSELPVTIGLGREGAVREVEIRWPGGAKQILTNPKIETELRVVEP
ncbi:MAG: CRTAC1 family protein [Verrucomicrobia bacterium]|nr:CRTAC1 family protein [Verrucomicrobiota bacterium]